MSTTDCTISLEPHPSNPRSRIRVLAGTDDGAPFRVTVPLHIRTVKDALDWLRPDHVPVDALRQGEFYFIPSAGPHRAAGCTHPDPKRIREADCGSHEYSDAGSHHEYRVVWRASFSRRHTATVCRAVVKSGSVAFRGRRATRTHDYTARPTYYVRGEVVHDEHGTLTLPTHDPSYQDDPLHQGDWYEVVPNRAHGPFPVWGYGPED